MNANVQRAGVGSGRLKPGAAPVLLAVIGALLVTLILASLFMRARTAPPAAMRQEQRSSNEVQVPAAKVQKPSAMRPMDARSAKVARARMRVRQTVTESAGSAAGDATVVGAQ